MAADRPARPADTDSAAVGRPPEAPFATPAPEKSIETTESGSAFTESHRPSDAEALPQTPSVEETAPILEREPDGRYRIIGRKPNPNHQE